MPVGFAIDAQWQACGHGLAEDRATAAKLRIAFDELVATRVESDWSHEVQDRVHVSAYPLAMWLAVNWWRLRWEPYPATGVPSPSWRMAHEVAAAGHGFLWPRLAFASDGPTVEAVCHASRQNSGEPVRYLSDFRCAVPATSFEAAVDDFVAEVIARLDTCGGVGRDLSTLWEEVKAERGDPAESVRRRLEARLGYDPDEAPEEILAHLLDLSGEAGEAALDEIAPALSGSATGIEDAIRKTVVAAHGKGVRVAVDLPSALRQHGVPDGTPPWDWGRSLAGAARKAWRLPSDGISNEDLARLLDAPKKAFLPDSAHNPGIPFGLAVREDDGAHLKLVFGKRNAPGIRFEAARFLADHLTAPESDAWLPATRTKTVRQKMQRAFAAELLCPIKALDSFMGGDYSDDRMEEAAEHFGVSVLTAKSHLANHDLIPPEMVRV
ncbi:hypothetical protein JL101_003540 [Skermanella rosea]|uniref:ImmA/IrrE family metallo-endopeptidase n=1 Tax=Skermanella rosea TaxID=1817965 RepID=UPI001931BF53|nr:hypothetical protein [Skermanella rosea]UEM04529.1 hypothetical protein JL101_003540 [Skermanella rosea]